MKKIKQLKKGQVGKSNVKKTEKEKKIVIIAPVFEKAANGIFFNTAVVINADGKTLGKYRKLHIPYDPLFYEQNYFAPGEGYLVHETRYG